MHLLKPDLTKQRERAMKVLAMMEGGPRTIFELTSELFPAVYEKELGLTLSETIGQTDYLVDEGLVRETTGEGGVLHYEKRKSILITGATSGVGYALTKRLLAEGHDVWATGRAPDSFGNCKMKVHTPYPQI